MQNDSQLGFGIAGTGVIAAIVADAIAASKNARLAAVSSRQIETARSFVAQRPGVAAVEGIEDLLRQPEVDAVYVATPTATKVEIALAAIAAGKHVLFDKPFPSHACAVRVAAAAAERGVLLMDATHFVHHPRTAAIKAACPEQIGRPQFLHTALYVSITDHNNIRYDVNREPMGALGDLAWYSMRAIVEFLHPEGPITKAAAVLDRDPKTNSVVRAAGLLAFEGGEVSTFDIGFTVGTLFMDFELMGTIGIIGMDDFVLDWTNSSHFKNPDIKTGYFHRTGMATRKDVTFIETPSEMTPEVLMIESFADLANSGDATQRGEPAVASLKTQEYLDAVWNAAV